ncbi:MAG: hypothetical protein ABJC05_04655 [Pyrinomonadaceae bacterium]
MKRCPQCDFVYEDDQGFCDMDGSELFHAAQTLPLPSLDNILPDAARMAPQAASIAPEPISQPAKPKRRSKPKRSPLPLIAAVVLLGVLFMVYYAVTHRLRARNSNQSVASVTAPPQATPELVPSPSDTKPPSSESSSQDQRAPSPAEKPSTPVRLPSSPVSAGGGTGRGPVVIRLNNGAAIRADEAWEKREGIWYRQGSTVTLLKRGSASTIERPAPARTVAAKPEMKKPSAGPDPKKESRISSLLKTTGRILKKPFRL